MCEPLDQDESTDPDLKRARAWTDYLCDLFDRAGDVAHKWFGPRPGVTIVILALTAWGLVTRQTWAVAASAGTWLLRHLPG